MVIIIGLSFITEAIKLKSINWILKTISDIWLIAFIIIFQTEIRKLLLLITRSKIFRFFVKSKISETIEELEDAIEDLAKSHIGALVVLPRTQNVMMSLSGGVALQANVTKELITSIFNPKSPLHDGAIVIDNQIITQARCTLPLANEIKKSGKTLGMRHKAALGLTQMVDAIVIVVSEETGRISIADGDDLLYDIKFADLSRILKEKLNVKG